MTDIKLSCICQCQLLYNFMSNLMTLTNTSCPLYFAHFRQVVKQTRDITHAAKSYKVDYRYIDWHLNCLKMNTTSIQMTRTNEIHHSLHVSCLSTILHEEATLRTTRKF